MGVSLLFVSGTQSIPLNLDGFEPLFEEGLELGTPSRRPDPLPAATSAMARKSRGRGGGRGGSGGRGGRGRARSEEIVPFTQVY